MKKAKNKKLFDKKLKKRVESCWHCDEMANHLDPDKWWGVKKCPVCGRSTKILLESWND